MPLGPSASELGDATRRPEAWVEFEPNPKLMKEGYNIVEVKLDSRPDLAEIPMIDLTVRYQ